MQDLDILNAPAPSANWRSLFRFGTGVIVFSVVILGSWAAVARLDAAAVAAGVISVESVRKTVQHLEGGMVREILVRNGASVKKGSVLLRLDPTRTDAAGETYRQQMAASLAIEARLTAQREGGETIQFPPEVTQLADQPYVQAVIADQQRQFKSRKDVLDASVGIIEAQINQAKQDIEQAKVERKTAEEQLKTIDVELPPLLELLPRGLVVVSRVTTLQRTQAQLRGVVDGAAVTIQKSTEKIGELRSQGLQLRQAYVQEAANQLPDVRKTIGDLRQQLVVAEDAAKRIDIIAPVSGKVQNMKIFTLGGVIRPGDAILDIVPADDTLVVQAKLSTYDIDRIAMGMNVEVRIPQFQTFQSQQMHGEVRTISSDTLMDEVTKQPYYAMEVAVDRSSIPTEINDKLTAGMNVDVIVPTDQRTVLQYLASPIFNRFAKAMRER
jgi:HlyD family type I secretion membrane fusion protein